MMNPAPTLSPAQRARRDLYRYGGPWFLAGVLLATLLLRVGLTDLLAVLSLAFCSTTFAGLILLKGRMRRQHAQLQQLQQRLHVQNADIRTHTQQVRELVLSIPPDVRRHVPPELLDALTAPN